MEVNTILIGYDENGNPLFKTVYGCPPMYVGNTYDEEGRTIPIYA